MAAVAYRPSLLIALVAVVAALAWNTWNLEVLRRTPGADHLLRERTTIATADDPSYLRPVEDLLTPMHHGQAPRGPQLRTPGYGLWYLIARLLFPIPAALTALKLFQCLLFGASVGLAHHALWRYAIPAPMAHGAMLTMAVLPMFHGFLFHTLTEGVTPALCVGIWAAAMMFARNGERVWLVTGTLLWSLLVITRPVLAWAGLPLLINLWPWTTGHGGVRRLALVLAVGSLPTAGWWLWNSAAVGAPISLHPVYSESTPGIFRPTHKAFWELAKSWGARGDQFHMAMVPAYEQALLGTVDTSVARAFLATAPAGHLTQQEQHQLRALYLQWAFFTRDRLRPAMHGPTGTLTGLQAEEVHIIKGLQVLTTHYRRTHAWHYHVVVPLNVLRGMVLHSNLNLYLFQHTYRGQWWMEALRWCCAGIHLLLFAALPFLVLVRRIPAPARAAAFGALLYLGYLAYVQRGVEERYTLPVLHLAMVMLPLLVEATIGHGRRWDEK